MFDSKPRGQSVFSLVCCSPAVMCIWIVLQSLRWTFK